MIERMKKMVLVICAEPILVICMCFIFAILLILPVIAFLYPEKIKFGKDNEDA